jgi:glucose/mannose-6-phosphate isomerase
MIKKFDQENQFEVLKNSYKQIEFAWNLECDFNSINKNNIGSVIVAGLGGSAVGGDILQNYLRDEQKFNLKVHRNYNLPSAINKNDLIIASSYSGNTEETISAVETALKKKCNIIVITTGGKLEEIAVKNELPVMKLEKGYQPRYALWINFFTLLKTLQSLNLVPNQDSIVKKIISLLKQKGDELSRESNKALESAEALIGFIPVIYSVSDFTSAVGFRFKCQLNENSKVHSVHNILPEMNHNEIIGWETFSNKQFNAKVINIWDDDYHPQIKKRLKITSELIGKSGAQIFDIKSNETNYKLRLFDLIYFTDWISYYLAIVRGKNPTSIENINYLKEHLAK